MKKRAIISIVLSAFLLMGNVVSYGATTQEKISDAKAKQQENQTSLQQTQEKIEELEGKKGESESYLQELNVQLNDLKVSLEKLQKDYDAKQAELTELQEELEQAKADEEQQYEDMKLRIRYMYENSANDYAALLFQSDSIADFLNQADNISKMTEYDRKQLENYKKTKEEIAEKEQEVAREKDEIVILQQESADKQAAVEELVAATYNQIQEYQADIQNQESEENTLLNMISQQEDEINALLRQAKEEEAAARLAAQKAAEEKAAAEAAKKAEAEKEAQAQQSTTKPVQKPTQKPTQKPSQSTGNQQSSGTGNNNSSSSKDEEKEPTIDSSQGKYLGRFKLTAYCTCSICCGKWAGGGTASGAAPTPGRTVAMGGVPFGTKLSINGTIYTVEDRGTAYGHVDILMGSHTEALRFGLKYADVYQVG